MKFSNTFVKVCYKYELYKISKCYLYPYTGTEKVKHIRGRNIYPPKNFSPVLKFFIWIPFVGCLFSYNIQIVFLQESKVLSSFRKLSLLHTLSNIPMNKCSLCIHQVVLRVDTLGKHTTHCNVVS